MLDELSNSMKAKLYDYAYTPFMSSFIISWIIINHKYVLVYISSIKIDEKLKLLNIYGKETVLKNPINDSILPFFQFLEIGSHFFWYPIFTAIFYVFLYPYIANIFYKHTGNMNNQKKKIKLEFERKRVISDEEKEEMYLENYDLTTKINLLKREVSTLESEYQNKLSENTKGMIKLTNLNKELSEQLVSHDDLIIEKNLSLEKIKVLKNNLVKAEKFEKNIELINKENQSYKNSIIKLETKNNKLELNIRNLQETNENLKEMIKTLELTSSSKSQLILEKERAFIKKFKLKLNAFDVLKVIYSQSIESNSLDGYIGQIKNHLQWSKIKLETILDELVVSGIIYIDRSHFSAGEYSINDLYKKELVRVFED